MSTINCQIRIDARDLAVIAKAAVASTHETTVGGLLRYTLEVMSRFHQSQGVSRPSSVGEALDELSQLGIKLGQLSKSRAVKDLAAEELVQAMRAIEWKDPSILEKALAAHEQGS